MFDVFRVLDVDNTRRICVLEFLQLADLIRMKDRAMLKIVRRYVAALVDPALHAEPRSLLCADDRVVVDAVFGAKSLPGEWYTAATALMVTRTRMTTMVTGAWELGRGGVSQRSARRTPNDDRTRRFRAWCRYVYASTWYVSARGRGTVPGNATVVLLTSSRHDHRPSLCW